jgi:hypothetical protein
VECLRIKEMGIMAKVQVDLAVDLVDVNQSPNFSKASSMAKLIRNLGSSKFKDSCQML